MAGATAATAAGVTASQAGTITVNLLNNYISATGGNHLNADLTGDRHPDLTITGASAFYRTYLHGTSSSFHRGRAQVILNGVFAAAIYYGDGGPIAEILGSQFADVRYHSDPRTLTGSIPISFKDLHINGGALTQGSLEVTVSNLNQTDTEVQLDSFTYSIPESSSLALLAMGAGGILAFRRWRTT